jgi:hypothetical protein
MIGGRNLLRSALFVCSALCAGVLPLRSQSTAEGIEFFERKIRPKQSS